MRGVEFEKSFVGSLQADFSLVALTDFFLLGKGVKVLGVLLLSRLERETRKTQRDT